MINMLYREITIDDIGKLMKLDKDLYTPSLQFTEDFYEELIKDILTYKVVIVDEDDNILGAIGIGENYYGENNNYIYFITIREDFQRHGLGSKLLCMGVNKCVDKDILLNTYDKNLIPFYEKNGFVVLSHRIGGIKMVKYVDK